MFFYAFIDFMFLAILSDFIATFSVQLLLFLFILTDLSFFSGFVSDLTGVSGRKQQDIPGLSFLFVQDSQFTTNGWHKLLF